jgi:hypothetical protein
MLERLGGGVERTCVLAAGEREMFDGMPNPDDRHGASPSHAGGVRSSAAAAAAAAVCSLPPSAHPVSTASVVGG